MRPRVLAVLGPTASGKSALGLALAARLHGEIINCDSTAVYRGFDIGTDKLPLAARCGIPHHLIDIADPVDIYTAAQFASDASAAIREIHRRGRLPILVGGTGFYYRALTRGLFPGPAADVSLRARLNAVADRRGIERLHAWLRRVDGPSADAAGTVRADRNSVSAIQCWRMSEVGRVEALKASFRGVVRAAESLDAVRERVEALSDEERPDAALLSELARIGTGIAVAAAALRSLSESSAEREESS